MMTFIRFRFIAAGLALIYKWKIVRLIIPASLVAAHPGRICFNMLSGAKADIPDRRRKITSLRPALFGQSWPRGSNKKRGEFRFGNSPRIAELWSLKKITKLAQG